MKDGAAQPVISPYVGHPSLQHFYPTLSRLRTSLIFHFRMENILEYTLLLADVSHVAAFSFVVCG